MKGKHTISIPGELASAASNGVVASADGVYDYNQGKFQEDINNETEGRLDGQDAKLNKKLAEIDQKYDEFEDKTDEYFKQESAKNSQKIDDAVKEIAKIPNNEVKVVDQLPDTGVANTIYRVIGETSYAEWAYTDGQWKKLAEHNNGIDDEPTAGSEKLVKSGGVNKAIAKSIYFKENDELAHKRCKELYFDNLDKSKRYYLGFLRYYDEKNPFVRLFSFTRDDKSDQQMVADCGEGNPLKGIVFLHSSGGSGITGYAVVDIDTTDTKNTTPELDVSICSDTNFSPTIKAHLGKFKERSISGEVIDYRTIEGDNLKRDSVGVDELKNDAVSTPKIKDKAVTPAKLSSNVFDNFIKGESNYTKGFYINKDGELVQDDNFCVTDAIDVKKVSQLALYFGITESKDAMICLFDSNDSVITYFMLGNEGSRIINIPESQYLRFSFTSDCDDARVAELANGNFLWKRKDDIGGIAHSLFYVPTHYKNLLGKKVMTIQNLDAECNSNGDCFVFVTDTHVEMNAMSSPALINSVLKNTSVRKVIHGGDVFHAAYLKNVAYKNASEWFSACPFEQFVAIGNHDTNSAGVDTERLTDDEVYGTFIKRSEHLIKGRNNLSYYFDNEVQKIRYFILDAHWPTIIDNRGVTIDYNGTLSWLEAELSNLDSSWNYVVIQHIVFSEFVTKDRVVTDIKLSTLAKMLIEKMDSMYDNPSLPKPIAVISGHTHYDWHTVSSKGYPIIASDCDSTWAMEFNEEGKLIDKSWSELRKVGTVNENAFDVIHINRKTKKIYCTRIGYGNDREFSFK